MQLVDSVKQAYIRRRPTDAERFREVFEAGIGAIGSYQPSHVSDDAYYETDLLHNHVSRAAARAGTIYWREIQRRSTIYGFRVLTGLVLRTAEVHPDPTSPEYIEALADRETLSRTLLAISGVGQDRSVAIEDRLALNELATPVTPKERLMYVATNTDTAYFAPERPIHPTTAPTSCQFARYYGTTTVAIAHKMQALGIMNNIAPAKTVAPEAKTV